jgi:nitroreductase
LKLSLIFLSFYFANDYELKRRPSTRLHFCTAKHPGVFPGTNSGRNNHPLIGSSYGRAVSNDERPVEIRGRAGPGLAFSDGGGVARRKDAAQRDTGDLDAAFERQVSFMLQDCSAAIENLLLAASTLGLGACWVGVHPSEKTVHRIKELLGLPSSVIPIAAISLGNPGEDPGPRTRFNKDYVHFEKW